MNPAPLYLRQEQFKFPVSHQWISAYKRNMEGLVLIDQGTATFETRSSPLKSESWRSSVCTPQMSRVESIAAGAA